MKRNKIAKLYFNENNTLTDLGISFIAEQQISGKRIDRVLLNHLKSNEDDKNQVNILVDFLLEENVFLKKNNYKKWQAYLFAAAILLSLLIPYMFYDVSFEENPDLEYLINSNLRSSDLRIISPTDSEQINSDTLFFQWQGRIPHNYTIVILDNLANEVHRYHTSSNRYNFVSGLSNGLYYWKLETDDYLVFTGRFLIRN
jgi:hypothetical protein